MRGLRVAELLRAEAASWLRILEVGCGTGWLCGALAQLGAVTAIDLSPARDRYPRRRGVDAEFIAANFFTHDFGTRLFDAIVCVEALFYVTDQARCVERIAQLLRPGGLLGLTVINKLVYERSSDIAPPEHGQIRHWLSKREVCELLVRHLDIVSLTTAAPRAIAGSCAG